MTPSACMTDDDAWLQLIPHVCKGIRALPVVQDHLEWWFCLTCDGCSSHVQPEACEFLTECEVALVQEDGDTSQINQACDQFVAKSNKLNIRKPMDMARLMDFDCAVCSST
jgi:hypothetical protein